MEIKKLGKKPVNHWTNDTFFQEYQNLVLEVFYNWVDFELEKMKDLTEKYQLDLQKYIRFGPATFQRQFLEQRFLDQVDNTQKDKFMSYLAAVETVFKTEKQSQNAKRESFDGPRKPKPENHDQFDSMISFSTRSSKKCLQKDRETQKKQAEVLQYGKVPGERTTETDSDRFAKTYEGKQVNFQYDIRRLCGQVKF